MLKVTNLTKTIVDKKFLTSVAKIVLKGENRETKEEISVVFVNSGKIKELNRKYRKTDKATDVLSFGENSQFPMTNDQLGEIVICPAEVRKNKKEIRGSFKKELAFVFIHGILHLLGYEHEKTKAEAMLMKQKEDCYFNQIF